MHGDELNGVVEKIRQFGTNVNDPVQDIETGSLGALDNVPERYPLSKYNFGFSRLFIDSAEIFDVLECVSYASLS